MSLGQGGVSGYSLLLRIIWIAFDLLCCHSEASLFLLTFILRRSCVLMQSWGCTVFLTKHSCPSIQTAAEDDIIGSGSGWYRGNFFRIRVTYFMNGNPSCFPRWLAVVKTPFLKNTRYSTLVRRIHSPGSPEHAKHFSLHGPVLSPALKALSLSWKAAQSCGDSGRWYAEKSVSKDRAPGVTGSAYSGSR